MSPVRGSNSETEDDDNRHFHRKRKTSTESRYEGSKKRIKKPARRMSVVSESESETEDDSNDKCKCTKSGHEGGKKTSEKSANKDNPRKTEENGGETEEESEEETDNESEQEVDGKKKTETKISVKLSDADVLDCPVCFEPLKLPVFQCKNGHLTCTSCCEKMSNKCGTCTLKTGNIRCIAIEKMIENLEFPCQNASYGCQQTMLYNKRIEHENTCNFVLYSCPLCDYVCSPSALMKLAEQFTFASKFKLSLGVVEHEHKHITLRDTSEDGNIFVLHLSNEPLGKTVNLVYAGRRTLTNKRYPYHLVAKDGDSSIKLDSFADTTATTTVKNFLLVPKNFITRSGRIELEITIWKQLSS